MRITKTGNDLRIKTKKYVLAIDRPQMLARLYLPEGDLYYHMSLLSAIDKVGRYDVTAGIKGVRVRRRPGHCLVEIAHSSSLWDDKKSYYKCYEDSLEYYLVVKGKGRVDRAYFFRGLLGKNELASIPGFDYVYPACTNFLEKDYFHASEYCSIGAGLESYAWGPSLASGPLCFAFSRDFKAPWLAVGVEARPVEYGFQRLEFNYKNESVANTWDSIIGTQAFSLAYFGHLAVNGTWETPHLVFHAAGDKYAAIRKYVAGLFDKKLLKKTRKTKYDWWNSPIFCGWHEQCAVGYGSSPRNLSRQYVESGKAAAEACTQKNYERWLALLRKKDIRPGIIIIDSKWQTARDVFTVEEKRWPNLRGFIDRCHAGGQKVMLWIGQWAREKAPADECLLMDRKPHCADPTNPKFVRRLKREIHTMLSDQPGCYNADGLKVDGTTAEPYGYKMKTRGNLYGFELQKRYLKIIYEAAKAAKKDALLTLFVANPFFLDVCDMVRLGDMYTVKGDPAGAMKTRAKIIRIGMPGVPIDTDGQFHFSMEPSFSQLIEEQAQLGVPTIYNAERMTRLRMFTIPGIGKLSDTDYRRIAKAFKDHGKGKV